MPASERPEAPAAPRADPDLAPIERLEAAVGRLLEELAAARDRADRSERAYAKLRAALEATQRQAGEAGETGDVQERIERLAEENRRLRETVAAARERAERIRSRLMVVEDEL